MCQYPNYCTSPSTHFVWDEFAIGICCYSPLSHCPWCILFNLPASPLPPPKKKRKRKRKQLRKNYFQFHLSTHHFHKDHNAPCLLPKVCITITREKLKTIVIYYAFIYLLYFWGGGGEGEINKVHYGLCVNGELQQKRFLCIFFWVGGLGKTRTYYARAMWKWRIDLVIVPGIIVSWFLFLLFCFVFFVPHTLKFGNQFNKT